ncbi:uncharacterized protein VTP21DRAFT_8475 [Calcarisporiella thermophila]|uniref:uncharacterized protein n=1 Tax=Calcarisporiella thermophila TaxID=911321 RepID=UPI003743CFFA
MESDHTENNTTGTLVEDDYTYVNNLYNACCDLYAKVGCLQVDGIDRLKALIVSEKRFLERLIQCPNEMHHVVTTNLNYLSAVYDTIIGSENVVGVMQLFRYGDISKKAKRHELRVDVVANGGLRWIKVTARNLKALRHELSGFEDIEEDEEDWSSNEDEPSKHNGTQEHGAANGFENEESNHFSLSSLPLFRSARQYLTAASYNTIHFRVPEIVFLFASIRRGENELVERKIFSQLEDMGILVELGPKSPRGKARTTFCQSLHVRAQTLTECLNLDITTLVTLVSSLCHTPNVSPDIFDAQALKFQAEEEAISPLLTRLRAMLRGHKLYTTESARAKFMEIVDLMGGPVEKARANSLFAGPGLGLGTDPENDSTDGLQRQLWAHFLSDEDAVLPRIQVLPDQPSERFLGLRGHNKISEAHIAVFGTGDAHQMNTLTSNVKVHRALIEAGIDAGLVLHGARSLAENRMKSAGAEAL